MTSRARPDGGAREPPPTPQSPRRTRFAWRAAGLLCAIGLLAIGSSACVETAAYEKAAADLEQARRAVTYKDQQIQAFQWQLAVLGQQFREAQQRSEAQQRDLAARLQQLGDANAELAGKLRDAEARRPPPEPAVEPPAGKVRPEDRARAEELRRLIAAVDARNAQLADSIARVERLLLLRGAGRVEGESPRKAQSATGDVVDPWGFGSRK